MYYCGEAVKFVPDLEEAKGFEASATEPSAEAEDAQGSAANASEETARAARNLDKIISTLSKNFAEGTDYFKVLVNVFQKVLLTSEHAQLKNFYMIIPALLLQQVESSL
eukprot:1540149-Prorocentrum_lima.AAC.1